MSYVVGVIHSVDACFTSFDVELQILALQPVMEKEIF